MDDLRERKGLWRMRAPDFSCSHPDLCQVIWSFCVCFLLSKIKWFLCSSARHLVLLHEGAKLCQGVTKLLWAVYGVWPCECLQQKRKKSQAKYSGRSVQTSRSDRAHHRENQAGVRARNHSSTQFCKFRASNFFVPCLQFPEVFLREGHIAI